MALAIIPSPYQQFDDDNGTPLANGSLEAYLAGTTTPHPLYDENGVSLGAVVALDGFGRVAAFMDTDYAYKFIVKRANGTTVRSQDIIRVAEPAVAQELPEWQLILNW